MRLTLAPTLAILVLSAATAGCNNGRLSDGDINRLCDLEARCGSSTDRTVCISNYRSQRDQANAIGCGSQLGNGVRCVLRADSCSLTLDCADEAQRLQACVDGASGRDDSGGVILPDAGGPVVPSEVRLGEGGMIEIYHAGSWRPICDDGFGQEEADVACRHLGFSGATSYSTITGPTDEFWLDDVVCTGSESFLDQCSHLDWGSENCTAGETQAVVCF